MSPAELYDRDFLEWAARNAELLRQGRFDEIDVDHVAEEIEDLGNNYRNAAFSHGTNLLAHLLKWRYQPERRGASWRSTIVNARVAIRRLYRKAPSLRRAFAEEVAEMYGDAALVASEETRLPKSTFPNECPFTLEQILDPDFLPEV